MSEGPGLAAGPWRAGAPADPAFWRPVDDAYQRLLSGEQAGGHPWLLLQTMATGVPRRALYGAMGLQPRWRLLDVGTGFGPVAVEAAGAYGCQVVGLDIDGAVLGRAAALVGDLQGEGWLASPGGRPGGDPATVALAAGDAVRLPFADGVFDAVATRFLLQHLVVPAAAVAELVRVVRPGGLVCVVDADDGLSLTWPEPPEPVRRLQDAFVAAQQARGGDRSVGRKVAGILDAAGVEVTAVLVLPQAAYGVSPPTGLAQRLLHHRLSAGADDMVDRGLLTRDEAEAGLRVLATEAIGPRTAVDGHMAVLGRRRPA